MMPPVVPGTRAEIVPEPPSTTLTYDQSAQLMNDFTFRGRVKTACLKFATSIENEDSTMQGHNARLRWATACYANPDQSAQQVTSPVVLDPNIQSAGSGVSDSGLQGAVEAVVSKFF